MSLMAVLEKISPGVGSELDPETSELPPMEDKVKKAYELKAKGVPVRNIAKSMGVSEATIYRWMKEYEKSFRARFQDRPREELLLDSLRFLSVVRDVAMAEVHQIDMDVVEVGPSGAVEKTGKPDRIAKHRMLKLAMESEKSAFTMLRDTGVLPNAVREIHYSVNDTRPDEMKKKETATPVTREEMVEMILNMIQATPKLPGPSEEELNTPITLVSKEDASI